MAELVRAVAAAAVWVGVLLLICAAVNRVANRRLTDARALLVAWPVYFFAQVVGIKLLDRVVRLDAVSMLALHAIIGVAAVVVAWRAGAVMAGGSDGEPREAGTLGADGSTARRRDAPAHATDADTAMVRRIALGVLGLSVAALAVFALLVPVHVWDVQAYHMPMIANYVQNGSLTPWPAQDLRQVYRVNGAELHMLALASLARSDAYVGLANVVAFAVSCVAAFHIGRLLLRNEALAWLVAVLVPTAPQILLGSVTAKNDLIFMALILCAFYWTLRVVREPDQLLMRRLVLLGGITGLAVATKVLGLNLLGAVGLALLVLALRRRLPLWTPVPFAAFSVAATVILVGDVYLRNAARAAEVPVGIMPGEVRFTSGLTNLIVAAQFYLYDLSFIRLIKPQVVEHDFSHYGYAFPFLLVLGIWASGRMIKRRTAEPGLGILALMTFALWASVIAVRIPINWDQRFMIWLVPVFAVLTASLLARTPARTLLVVVCFASAFALGNLFRTFTDASDGMFLKSAAHLVRNGELARLAHVSQPKYEFKIDGFEALDAAASPTDSILYVGFEDTWMYPAWGRRFERHVSGVASPADAARRLFTGSYRFLVVEGDATDEMRETALQAAIGAGYNDIVAADGRRILERPRRGVGGMADGSRVPERPRDGVRARQSQ